MRAAREAAGHSQAKCAALIDVSERSYKSYELGKREPPLGRVVDFCKCLNVDLRWLILGEETFDNQSLVCLTERISSELFQHSEYTKMSPNKFGRLVRYVLEQCMAKGSQPDLEVKEVISIFGTERDE
ncbi:helix-turn-helix transcriptional regulator [Mameliella alba]|nr:helix-turn-helix transcriptional regulator [Antarctobacter heliothermus]MBY6145248.1 helix-turn-helix transcriptional regulator [Mameliella alba]